MGRFPTEAFFLTGLGAVSVLSCLLEGDFFLSLFDVQGSSLLATLPGMDVPYREVNPGCLNSVFLGSDQFRCGHFQVGFTRFPVTIQTCFPVTIGVVKKWGYSLIKIAVFSYFVFRVEKQFSLMRNHIARNGGLRKQGYGLYRPY